MRRVAFRISFEPLDRRENPGTSWGIFGLLGAVSSLLDHSHAKAKPEKKAEHTAVMVLPEKAAHLSFTHPAHQEHAQSVHQAVAKTASPATGAKA